jgi:sugar lactone lactonase YvrE
VKSPPPFFKGFILEERTVKKRTLILAGLLSAFSLGAFGCAWFVIGGTGILVYSLQEDDEGPVNAPPSGSISYPFANAHTADRVAIRYTLIDPEEENCSISVAYSTDGGATWLAATEAPGYPSEGIAGLAAAASGTVHTFIWNSMGDLGNVNHPDTAVGRGPILVAITPTDAQGLPGAPFASEAFRVYNEYVSTFFGGELSELDIAFPTDIKWVKGVGGNPDKILVADEFQSRVVEINLATGTLSVVAGTGNAGYTGDNLPADTTGLTMPSSICKDPDGNLYIADLGVHRVRRVDAASNFITTFAGSGMRGYGGEDEAPAGSTLNFPRGVAFDPTRNLLYIADTGNNCIRAANLGNLPRRAASTWVAPGTLATIVGAPGQGWGQSDGRAGLPGCVGAYVSLQIDSTGKPRAAYYDEMNCNLKYAYYTGTYWIVQSVDCAGQVGMHCSLALDSQDTPYISYYDGDNMCLKFARLDTGANTWRIRRLDVTGDTGKHTSIAVYEPSAGTVEIHIAYFTEDNGGELRCAHWTGMDWTIETVDDGGTFFDDVGRYASMALDSSGNPHIAYYNASMEDLLYRYYDPAGGSGPGWYDRGVPVAGNLDSGQYCSLALDSMDRPHIAFFFDDLSSIENLQYTYWNGSAWTLPVIVDNPINNEVGKYCSLALDAANHPHIAYYDEFNDHLKYAVDANGNGNFLDLGEIVTVDNSWSNGTFPSLVLQGGQPRIAYVELGGSNNDESRLKFAVKSGSNFSLSFIDTGMAAMIDEPQVIELDADGNLFFTTNDAVYFLNAGLSPTTVAGVTVYPCHVKTLAGVPAPQTSIAFDGTSSHIAYTDPSTGALRYAIPSDPPVQIEEPDPGTAKAGFPTIAVESGGNVHIAYYSYDTNSLLYVFWNGTNWSTPVTVDGGPSLDVGRYASLALDTSDNPHIAYYDMTNGNLKYAQWTGGAWTTEVAHGSTTLDLGRFASLAIDSVNTVHIAYFNVSNTSLMYRTKTGAIWQTPETVDGTTTQTGMYASLAVSSTGIPHISYYEGSQRALKYAYKVGSWNLTTVDSSGDIGKYSAIALDAGGNPHIACRHGTWDEGVYYRGTPSFPPTGWEGIFFTWSGVAHVDLAVDSSGFPATGYVSFSIPDDWGEVRVQEIDIPAFPTNLGQASEYRINRRRFSDSYAGDGGPAADALFSEVRGMALARYGVYSGTPPAHDALLLADAQNARIRVINLNNPGDPNAVTITVANRQIGPGKIDTILGNGDFTYDPSDDGAMVDNAVDPVELAMPQDVSTDENGNVLVADSVNSRVRVLNVGTVPLNWGTVSIPPGHIDSVLGGTAATAVTTSLFYPAGIAVDTSGVYVTDYLGYIFRIDPIARTSSIVAGAGGLGYDGDGMSAMNAVFWGPHALALDSQGNLYVLDRGNFRIRIINQSGTPYTIGSGTDTRTIAPGNIDAILGTGVMTGEIDGPMMGSPLDDLGDGGSCIKATTTEITGLAIDSRPTINGTTNSRGVLYISDRQNYRVRAVNLNPPGSSTITIGSVQIPAGQIVTLMGDGTNGRYSFDPWGSLGQAIPRPSALTFEATTGLLLVMFEEPYILVAFNTNSSMTVPLPPDINIAGEAISPDQMGHIAGHLNNFEGGFNGDGIPAVMAQFMEPGYLAMYCDPANPTDIVEIYISDRQQQRIRMIDANGIIHTWAGTGEVGFNGEGVPPHNVLLNEPLGIALFNNGANDLIYYVDARNKRVRWQVK